MRSDGGACVARKCLRLRGCHVSVKYLPYPNHLSIAVLNETCLAFLLHLRYNSIISSFERTCIHFVGPFFFLRSGDFVLTHIIIMRFNSFNSSKRVHIIHMIDLSFIIIIIFAKFL